VANIYPFNGTAGTPQMNAGPSTPNTNALAITSTGLLATGSSAFNLAQQRISSGFVTTFTFQINNYPAAGAQGFTFIAQCGADGVYARGGASGNLGFNGLPKALVVEFDMAKDTWDDDNNHVSIFTAYSGNVNVAVPLTNQLTNQATGTLNIMANGAPHTARVDYYPRVGSSTGYGSVKVWVDNVLVSQSDVSDGGIATMCPNGLVYVGFTASTSTTIYANTWISNWRFNTVPTPASASIAVGNFQTQTASYSQSTGRQLYIQSADVCGVAVTGQGGGDVVVATLEMVSDGTIIPSSTATSDNNDGTYSVWFWYSSPTTLRLSLAINGQQITNSPFTITIVPYDIILINDEYYYGYLSRYGDSKYYSFFVGNTTSDITIKVGGVTSGAELLVYIRNDGTQASPTDSMWKLTIRAAGNDNEGSIEVTAADAFACINCRYSIMLQSASMIGIMSYRIVAYSYQPQHSSSTGGGVSSSSSSTGTYPVDDSIVLINNIPRQGVMSNNQHDYYSFNVSTSVPVDVTIHVRPLNSVYLYSNLVACNDGVRPTTNESQFISYGFQSLSITVLATDPLSCSTQPQCRYSILLYGVSVMFQYSELYEIVAMATPTSTTQSSSTGVAASPSTGSDGNVWCGVGQYKLNGTQTCLGCPMGSYQPSSTYASSFCWLCQSGTYSSSVGNRNCSLCSPATYQPSQGMTSCLSCAAVTWSGATSCPSSLSSSTGGRSSSSSSSSTGIAGSSSSTGVRPSSSNISSSSSSTGSSVPNTCGIDNINLSGLTRSSYAHSSYICI
jgi:hypothetical protein